MSTLAMSHPEPLLKRLEEAAPPQRAVVVRAESNNVHEVLMNLAAECEAVVVSDVARARRLAGMVIDLADEIGHASARARARRAMAQIMAYAGDFQDSLATAREAFRMAADGGDAIEAARARLASIHSLGELGRYPEAVEAGEAARTELLAAGAIELAARADFNLGVIRRKQGDPGQAIIHFDAAVSQFLNQPGILAQLQSNRGEALLELDRFDESARAFEAALTLFENTENMWGAAIVEGNLADLATRQGMPAEAMRFFTSARERLCNAGSPTHHARLVLEHGDVKRMIGLYREALNDYHDAIIVLDEHGDRANHARALHGRGVAMASLGSFGPAAQALDEAVAMQRDLNPAACARSKLARAEVAMLMDEFDDVMSVLDEVTTSFAPGSLDRTRAMILRGQAFMHLGHLSRASEQLTFAVDQARALGVTPLLADALKSRGEASLLSGDPLDAIRDFREGVAAIERTRDSLQSSKLRASFLGERDDGYMELFDALAAQPASSSRTSEIFKLSEQIRSRSLLETLANTPAEEESEPREVSEHRNTMRALNTHYASLNTANTSTHEWRDRAASLESKIATLETSLGSRGHSARCAVLAELEQLQSRLPESTSYLQFLMGKRNVSAIAITAHSVEIHSAVAERAAVESLVEQLHFQIGRALRPGTLESTRRERLTEDSNRVLDQLGEHLFGKVDLTGKQQLIVSAAGSLHTVPMAALRLADGHLAERLAVTNVPSASILCSMYDRRDADTPAHGEFLIVGVADEHAPAIADEAAALANLIPHATLLNGKDATIDGVMGALQAARFAHLACHGRYDPLLPHASGLRLVDGWLTLRQIAQLALPNTTVTLAACETGRNHLERGNEQFGLQRAFIQAGACSIVSSLWPAHDATSFNFMGAFNQALLTLQFSPALALQHAQRHVMATEPHIARWAHFTLAGLP